MSKSNCNQLSTTEQVLQEHAVKCLCAFLEEARKARVKKVVRKDQVGRWKYTCTQTGNLTLLISRVYQHGKEELFTDVEQLNQHGSMLLKL